jgi:hypothetical protein
MATENVAIKALNRVRKSAPVSLELSVIAISADDFLKVALNLFDTVEISACD